MKKYILFTILIICFAMFTFFISSYADNNVSLVINGKNVYCDVPPVISNGRTLVPVRVLFEHMGAEVEWNDVFRQVTVNAPGNRMIFNIDSTVMNLNGEAHIMDVAPIIINGRTLVPIRFIASTMGYAVKWDEVSRTVFVENVSQEERPTQIVQNAQITSVSTNSGENTYTVNISISKKTEPKIMILSDPYRIVLDFYNTTLQGKDGNNKSSGGLVVETRWAQHTEYTRFVIECASECPYTSLYTSDTVYTVTVRTNSSTQTENNIQSSGNSQPDNIPQTEKKPVYKPPGTSPVVVIDAGHGGYDPGAVGRDENDNIVLKEKDVCLNIALKVCNTLQSSGVTVIMTRSTDVALGDTEQDDLGKRTEIANNANACLFVSIHNNGFTNPSANGTCVLYAGLGTSSDYGITGKELAQNIQNELIQATGLRDRGIVESPGIAVLRKTAMPAALVECAFITNESDRQVLASEDGQNKMANAISRGILNSLVKMGYLK